MHIIVIGAAPFRCSPRTAPTCGAVGSAVAFSLADRGVDVTIYERGSVAGGASGAAAGMLAPLSEAPDGGPLLTAGLDALAELGAWTEAVEDAAGIEIESSHGGTMVLALGAEQATQLHARLDWQRDLDPEVRWVDPAALARIAPHLRDGLAGALHYPREGQVNARRYTRVMALAAVARGASLREETSVRSLLTDGAAIIGVEIDGDRLLADAVVLAPGADGSLLEGLGIKLPLVPVKGELVRLRPIEPLSGFLLFASGYYLAPTGDGTVIVGATELPGDDSLTVAVGSLSRLLEFATDIVPSLRQASFVGAWAGLRPTLPDHLPAIGPVLGFRGLWLAIGHYRNGILLSGWTGRRLADAILDGAALPMAMLPDRLMTGI